MSDQGVMTTPIFDELLSKFGVDLVKADAPPETSEEPVEGDDVPAG